MTHICDRPVVRRHVIYKKSHFANVMAMQLQLVICHSLHPQITKFLVVVYINGIINGWLIQLNWIIELYKLIMMSRQRIFCIICNAETNLVQWPIAHSFCHHNSKLIEISYCNHSIPRWYINTTFAHISTEQLLCHVQNVVVITL